MIKISNNNYYNKINEIINTGIVKIFIIILLKLFFFIIIAPLLLLSFFIIMMTMMIMATMRSFYTSCTRIPYIIFEPVTFNAFPTS